LPLQWGGNKYAWSDPVIIGTFCGFAVATAVFAIYEWKFAGETCILPFRLLSDRTQIGSCLAMFFLFFGFLEAVYYLPIFYQAVHGDSATKSGLSILAFMIGIVVSSGLAGFLITEWGRYWPFLFFGPMISAVSFGLLYTLDENTSNGKLIGFQILCAVGLGFAFQQPLIAVQVDNKIPKDTPQKMAIVTFSQLVGGTIGISLATTIFTTKLSSSLLEFAPTAPTAVLQSVAAIRSTPMDPTVLAAVIHAYVKALDNTFLLGLAGTLLASISSLLVRNLSVKGKNLEMGGA
jgi:MFS family permease